MAIADYYVAKMLDEIDIQFNNLWDLYIFEGGFSFSSIDWSKSFLMKVQTASLPFYNIDMDTLVNFEKRYRTATFSGQVNFSIIETSDAKTLKYVEEWFSYIFDKHRGVFKLIKGHEDKAIRQGILNLQNGNGEVIAQFVLNNLRLSGIEDLELTREEGQPLIYSVKMVCDSIDTIFNDKKI